MSLVRKNIVANLIGSGWVALISIAFIPLYIHFMGIESYGLVGFYITLQALFALLDMGMTATVSRELARLSASTDQNQQMRDLVRSLEFIYWGVAALVIISVLLLAPWVASHWLNANQLSEETVQYSIILMGIMIALRMPYGFYGGGLLGLQRQVLLNVVKVAVETLKSGGVVLILWLLTPTIITFFLWQTAISALGLCLMGWCLWHHLPSNKAARFRLKLYRRIWRFAAGMSIISGLALVLTQLDKLILSKMLSLEVFAYYMLASTVSMGIYVIVAPLFSAIYPRLTQLVSSADDVSVKHLYHKSCQLMTVLVMPIALLISFFSEKILLLWTHDQMVASQAAPILSLLIIGTALNGMMNIPYALQLAYGWTRFAIYVNLVAIVILIPALIIAISNYGAMGGAVIWLCLNTGYIFFALPFMHGKLLKGEFFQWLTSDFFLPTVAALFMIFLSQLLIPNDLNQFFLVVWLLLTYLFSFIAAVFLASTLRLITWSWACKHVQLAG